MIGEKSNKLKSWQFWLIILGVIVLVIGSFFARDLMLRAGIIEYDKKDILNFQTKYSRMLENIKDKALSEDKFVISAKRNDLLEKSSIDFSCEVDDSLREQVYSVCNSYCYSIEKIVYEDEKATLVVFSCSQNDIKCIVYAVDGIMPQKFSTMADPLGENWFYVGSDDNLAANLFFTNN